MNVTTEEKDNVTELFHVKFSTHVMNEIGKSGVCQRSQRVVGTATLTDQYRCHEKRINLGEETVSKICRENVSCRDEKFLSGVQTLRGTGLQKIYDTVRYRFLVRSHHTVKPSKQIRQKRQGFDLRCCQLTEFLSKFGFCRWLDELQFQRVHHERYENVNVGLNISRIELK